MHGPSFLQRFTTAVHYVLAVDGDGSAGTRALENRLAFITSLRREYGLDETCWHTVHCARDTNPLDYASPLHDNGGIATAADLATLWREHLHQGLFVPTTGTGGHPTGRRALHAFASAPRLVAQVQLIVTPTAPTWETTTYVHDLAEDVRILQPLWDVPADLPDTDAARLHLVVKATHADTSDAYATVFDILRAAGLSRTRSHTTLADPRLTTFETITRPHERDSGSPETQADEGLHGRTDDPLHTRFGIHTSGALFSLTPADTTTLLPYNWDKLRRAATRAGWAA